MNWQHIRAILIAAAQAAAGSTIPLLATQSWTAALATFVALFVIIALGNLFHLNLTPAQQASVAAAVVPAIERLIPALVALLERQPAPPVTVVTPPAPAPVAVVTPAPEPAPAPTPTPPTP